MRVFPLTSIVSLLYVMHNGESGEIALVGRDGMRRVTLFTVGNSTTIRAVVQSAGKGYCLPASDRGTLEASSCECYASGRDECRRLFPAGKGQPMEVAVA